MTQPSQTLISAVRVKKLFGLYSYDLPSDGVFQNAAILYGDNGVGKSTILRIAFHMLSAANNRGHRQAIYEVDFASFEVDLVSGITIKASRTANDPFRFLNLRILKDREILAEWKYRPKSSHAAEVEVPDYDYHVVTGKDGKLRMVTLPSSAKKADPPSHPQGESAYMSVLKKFAPTVFILNADRRLDSDAVPNPSDEMELRRVMRYEEPKHINDLVIRSREIALSQSMGAAINWVRQKALQGANQGSTNVHSVYTDVLQHIMQRSSDIASQVTKADIAHLIGRLNRIEIRTAAFAHYELATELSLTELYKSLKSKSPKSSALAVELLKPYIASLEGRLDAVEPVYHVIDKFVTIVNKFLSDKVLSFKLSQGFMVANRLGALLGPAQLSSGEQQLFLLFYYVLTGREKPSIFMIDEPEISLNIKWQRQLVQSLLDISDGASMQFLFASHSMELLSQHRNRVVRLETID